ncbi:hypothetical protein KUCAC02_019835, partial [Chaenocephalus aceratus]
EFRGQEDLSAVTERIMGVGIPLAVITALRQHPFLLHYNTLSKDNTESGGKMSLSSNVRFGPLHENPSPVGFLTFQPGLELELVFKKREKCFEDAIERMASSLRPMQRWVQWLNLTKRG